MTAERVDVYVEQGAKRVMASGLNWPGWSRGGRDEAAALASLLDYAPRYAAVARAASLAFAVPTSGAALEIVERLPGDAGTDFGVPSIAPAADREPVGEDELQRLLALLAACWAALGEAARGARGRELKKGPRGGGRELDAIIRHVTESEAGYLRAIGRKAESQDAADVEDALERVHRSVADGLVAAVREGVPAAGPRGGARWAPRYFARRVAYHVLDHAWEIEDRQL